MGGAGPALHQQCPTRERACHPRANSAQPSDFNMHCSHKPLWSHGSWTSSQTPAVEHHGPRHGSQQQFGLRCHHGLGGSPSHPDQYCPGGNKALKQQHGLRWLSRPRVSAQLSMARGGMNNNPTPGCCWAMNLNMALYSSPGPDNTMVPCGSAGNAGWHGPGSNKVHRLWPTPWASVWLLMAPQATDINTYPAAVGP